MVKFHAGWEGSITAGRKCLFFSWEWLHTKAYTASWWGQASIHAFVGVWSMRQGRLLVEFVTTSAESLFTPFTYPFTPSRWAEVFFSLHVEKNVCRITLHFLDSDRVRTLRKRWDLIFSFHTKSNLELLPSLLSWGLWETGRGIRFQMRKVKCEESDQFPCLPSRPWGCTLHLP